MSPSLPSSLSRRALLDYAGCGLGGLIFWPKCLLGADTDREKLKFSVISDTHLGYRDQGSAEKQWRATAAELAQADGDFILHLGDVVDGGREPQYPIYRAIRDTIGKPVHEIPGNHDPVDLFEKYLRSPIDTAVDKGWLRVLLLNDSHRDSHDGFLTAEQLAWIDEQCGEAAQKKLLVLICLHVPVHDNRHPDRGWHVKPAHGQKVFYDILSRHADRVLAVFHGHFHNGLRGWDDHAAVPEIVFPSALYNQDRKLEEQKAPGYNPSEFRPGFALIEIDGPVMKLRYKPVGVEPTVGREYRQRRDA